MLSPAEAEVYVLAEGAADRELHGIYRRAQLALEAARAVLTDRACLTRQGAAYLGVPFNAPAYQQLVAWEGYPYSV
jgi:hypothetical protein